MILANLTPMDTQISYYISINIIDISVSDILSHQEIIYHSRIVYITHRLKETKISERL